MSFDSQHADVPKAPGDLRIAVYRIVKFFAFLIAGTLVVKYALFDTIGINTDQMAPTLLDGDRVCIFRLPAVMPFKAMNLPTRKSPVIVSHPLFQNKRGCLRVAGLPGDSIVVSQGKLLIVNKPGVSFGTTLLADDALPPEYSPRDTMAPYRLPRKGDTLNMDTLTLRDFFYACAMIQQENPALVCAVAADLYIDGVLVNDYTIKEFPLYKGALKAIPKKYEYDWFFWDRLKEYLSRTLRGKDIVLTLSLFKNNVRVSKYILKEQFVFLVADEWRKGFDSRYFGPVLARAIRGSVLFVVWSIRPHGEVGSFIRMDRLIKVVK
jgi:signal peptidase I